MVIDKLFYRPVEYAVVQSPVKLCVSSNWESSIPTSRGICGSHSNIKSSVVWDTKILKCMLVWNSDTVSHYDLLLSIFRLHICVSWE